MNDRKWSETNARSDREEAVRRAEMEAPFDRLQRQLDDLRQDILQMGVEPQRTPASREGA